MRRKIGFIGLGVMGEPMARHLARGGHALTVLDADAARTRRVAADIGATAAATPAEVAAASEIVVTMLPDGEVVHAVATGEQGLVHGMAAGTLLLDCSSAEPWLTARTAEALAACGATMVDAPVSGAAWGAAEAKLVFMVGASDADLARVRPLLALMGHRVHHLGGLGAGHTMKCINNTITAMTLAATAEGLVLGQRAGLDPAVMVDVLNDSTGGSWITQTHFHQRIFNGRYDDPFKLALMVKDIGIAMRLAEGLHAKLPMATRGQQLWAEARGSAAADASVSEFVRWAERVAGVELRPRAVP